MPVANFRFYAELNDFLLPERRFTEFAYGFLDVATVKDRIESFGVPHTEVDLILVNRTIGGFRLPGSGSVSTRSSRRSTSPD